MSAPVKVDLKKSTSSIEPIAAFAPNASMSFCLSVLLLITITEYPFCTNSSVSDLPMFPNEPVTTIFNLLFFDATKVSNGQKTDVVKSTLVVVKRDVNFVFVIYEIPRYEKTKRNSMVKKCVYLKENEKNKKYSKKLNFVNN